MDYEELTPGTKIKLPTKQQLLDYGWEDIGGRLDHDDAKEYIQLQWEPLLGTVVTIEDYIEDNELYNLEEDHQWRMEGWDLNCLHEQGLLMIRGIIPSTPLHICEEGKTPLMGWLICKHCGSNLRPVK